MTTPFLDGGPRAAGPPPDRPNGGGPRARRRPGTTAWVAGVGVAAAVPYLVLKLLWVAGRPVGTDDPAEMDELWLVNLLTIGMGSVSVLLSLAFARPWGRRVPAGWLAFPMWVGTGLLGTILVALPLFLLSTLVLGPPDPGPPADGGSDGGGSGDGAAAGWVFPLVYGGFTVQGIALITGFLLYARERWAPLLRSRIGELPHSPTLGVQRAFAGTAVVPALVVAAAHLYWAAGGENGLPAEWVEQRNRGVTVMDTVTAVMAVAAVTALLVLVLRLCPGRGVRVPLAVAWTAAGSVFGWGAWQLVAYGAVAGDPGPGRALPGLLTLVQSLQVVTGLLVLMTGAIALAERAATAAGAGAAAAGTGAAVAGAGFGGAGSDVESAR
ncbi:hypothetical protein ACWEQL_20455 [Kitasatospora sp. NPDC004240]